MKRTLRLVKGDIVRAAASAIVTSANDSLVGNAQPLYWRFASRQNVDGSVRAHAGPRLAQACLDFAVVPIVSGYSSLSEGPLRDISRWEETCKRGSSATMRCAPGDAVVTKAFDLDTDHVIHAVTPDSEFGYEGPSS